MNNKPKTRPTLADARRKAENYCSYQERSHREVQNKLYNMGLSEAEIDDVLVHLIKANFLNEERFANAFAGGKFRTKHWGKVKIKNEMRNKGVNDALIASTINSFSTEEYSNMLRTVMLKKDKSIKEINPLKRIQKLRVFLIGKGFESELVFSETNKYFKEKY
jgi:regulatory protein